MQKKILLVIPILGGGGAERVVSHLANNLNRDKYLPSILLVLEGKHGYIKYLKGDIKIIQLGIKTRLRYVPFKVFRAIKKQKPDVVLVGLGELALLLAPFVPFYKKPKWIARETNTLDIRVTNPIHKQLYRIFYKNYDCILAESKDMRDDLVNLMKVPSQKVRLINNPFDTNFVQNQLKKNIAVSLPKNKINLLACGRLTYQKGFDNLIRSFGTIKNREAYHLTILGNAHKKDSQNHETLIKKLIQEFDLEKNVTLAGFQKNVHHWLKNADYFILSSRYEGLPNILLEAIYCGTPALANRCRGGIDEVIIERKNGLIFDFKQGDFEEKLQEIQKISFDKKQLARDILGRFDVEKIAKKYEKIL